MHCTCYLFVSFQGYSAYSINPDSCSPIFASMRTRQTWTFWYFADKCNDWTWPLESCARVELWSSSRLVFIHPWNGSSLTLCRFCFELLPHKASWLPRAPTLFGEKMLSFMPRSWFIIYVLIFLHLLVQIPRELPEINKYSSLESSHWCEDREARNWGLIK